MATLIPKPTVIEAAGNKPKLIEEFFGRVNSGTAATSIARMRKFTQPVFARQRMTASTIG